LQYNIIYFDIQILEQKRNRYKKKETKRYKYKRQMQEAIARGTRQRGEKHLAR
jgi:hypothetical protein